MTDIARLLDALLFAAERHKHQRRKDKEASPYVNHPIKLARLLAVDGGVADVEILMAAVLHDTLEDTDTQPQELREHFGERVAAIVVEVTDDRALPPKRRKELQIEHAHLLSHEAAMVKLADKTCNLLDMASAPPAGWPLLRRQDYFDWARKVVDRLPKVSPKLLAAFDAACLARPSA